MATATTREDNEENAASSGLSTSVHPNAQTLCPSPFEASPVIFVGFGTGANSTLHLAAAPIQHEHTDNSGGGSRSSTLDDATRGVDGDNGVSKIRIGRSQRITDANDVGSTAQEQDTPNRNSRGKASDGLLVSMLRRHGFRMGGLILVNGFVSLDEQSMEVRGLHCARWIDLGHQMPVLSSSRLFEGTRAVCGSCWIEQIFVE